ncbi:hypothetical protein Trydic_g8422 [Trypoxylus dichotomus]
MQSPSDSPATSHIELRSAPSPPIANRKYGLKYGEIGFKIDEKGSDKEEEREEPTQNSMQSHNLQKLPPLVLREEGKLELIRRMILKLEAAEILKRGTKYATTIYCAYSL